MSVAGELKDIVSVRLAISRLQHAEAPNRLRNVILTFNVHRFDALVRSRRRGYSGVARRLGIAKVSSRTIF